MTQIKQWYKKTELWIIPKDWEIGKLNDLVFITTWKKDVNEWNQNWNYPFFTCAKNITYSDSYSFDTEAILISGNWVWVWYTHYYSWKFEAYQRTYILSNFKENIFPKYLKKNLELNIKNNILKEKWGSAMPYIRLWTLQNYYFLIPPIKEQQKIADILLSLDELIEKTDKVIEKQKRLKKWTMQKLFSEWIWHNEFVEHPKFGKIPKDWEVVKLGDVYQILDWDRWTNYPKQNDFLNEWYCLFLSAKNVTKNWFRFSENQFISKEKDLILRSWKLVRNDLILTTRWTIWNIFIYDEKIKYDNIRINSWMVILRDNKLKILPKFLYTIFNSYIIQEQIVKISFWSAQPQLTVKWIRNIFLVNPKIEEQQKIIDILSWIDENIEKEEKYKEKLVRLKNGLMQKLLSWEVRVNF